MTHRPIDRIRSGTPIYRGADIDTMRDTILEDGVVQGSDALVWDSMPADVDKEAPRDAKFSEVEWEGEPPNRENFERRYVTGGMTDEIQSTRRFRGSNNLIAVFDSSDLPFEKVEYTHGWMSNHPGALTQILTTAVGEIHTHGVGVWGVVETGITAREERFYKIKHSTPDNIPATNPQSRFAEENEWLAFQDSVNITRGLEGVVAVSDVGSLGIRARTALENTVEPPDVPEVDSGLVARYYNYLVRELDNPRVPLYVIVFSSGEPESGSYSPREIEFAHGPDGQLRPSDVPEKFLGG